MQRRQYWSSHLEYNKLEEIYRDSDPNMDLDEVKYDGQISNLISSRLLVDSDDRPRHLPVLDIDFPCQLVPSSTPGHFHLYLDGMKPLSWEEYEKLLEALADAGIIEEGYFYAAKQRKQTLVRKPGIKKQQEDKF